MRHLSRLVVRFVGWCIAAFAFVLAVVLLAGAAYLLFFDYPEHIRTWMESEASSALGRPVRIESFSVDLPNSFELVGVSADPQGSGPPWLEFDKLRAELKLRGVFSSRLQLSMLHVDGLVLRIQDYGGGRVDLPGLWRPEVEARRTTPDAPLSIEAERIVINDAQFLYENHNLPWRLEAYQVEAAVERTRSGSYQGHLSYDRGQLKVKDRPAFGGGIAAQLELVSDELRLNELRATGPFYELRAHGTVDLKDQPEGQFVVDVESRVGPAAQSLLGWPQLDDRGPLPARVHGNLSVGRGWHLFEGDLDVPMAKFLGISLRDWKGKIYWNRTVLELSEAGGLVANGDTDLLFSQPLPVAEHSARLSMQFQGVSLRTLTESITGEPGYLDSSLSGEVRLSMPPSNPLRASGDFELVGRPLVETTDGQYSLELDAQGVLDEGTVTLSASHFDTGSTAASLTGLYPWSGAAELSVEISSRDLREADRLQQILRGLFHPGETIPLLTLEGRGDVGGVLTGRMPALTFHGRFRGADVRFREIEFGQLEAQGVIDATHLRLAALHAQKGSSEIQGEMALDLTEPGSEWSFDGAIDEWPVSDIGRLIPLPFDVTGTLSTDGSVVTEDGQYRGQGNITLEAGSINGVGFDEGRAEVALRGQQAVLKSIVISRSDANVSGQLQLDSGAGRLEGRLEGSELPLAVFSRDGFELQGVARGELQLTGTLDEPTLEMTLSSPNVSLGQTAIGAGRLEAQVDRGVATAKLTLEDPAFKLEAGSRFRLSSGNPFEGEVRWQGADLGPWVRVFRPGLPASVRFFSDGEASFRGEWSSLSSTEVDASVKSIKAEMGGYRLVSEEAVDVIVRNGIAETQGLQLSGEGTRLELVGKIPLGEGNLDLQANGSANLGLLQSFYPSVSSSGDVRLSAGIRGDWNRPYLSGQADISSGVLRFRGFPQAIGDIRGRVAFDNRTVRFPNLQATFGGAPVGISGTTLLSGLRPSSFELRVIGQGLRLRYPEGLTATLNGNLHVSGTPQSQILSGRINVQDAQWVREYDLATGILVSQDDEGFEILDDVGEESAFTNLRLDIEIDAPGTFKIRNSRAKIDAEAQLQMRGTFTRPVLLGRSEALRGELFLLGQRYDLVSGRVDFIDPASVKPFFDVVAESRVKSYRVELRLTGTPDRFFPELSSDPPLRTVDILRLLAGASERDILIGSEEEEIAGVGVASLLTERLTQEVGKRAERLFGLDRFSIDPFLVGQFANPTARVSVGKEIYRNLSVNYSTNLNAATETLILVEYTPEGPIRWIFSRDEEGALGVDLRFRKSF